MMTAPQVSVPVAEPLTATLVSAGHSRVLSAGQLIEGAVVSTTLMVCVQLAELPQASVAVQVRVMVSVLPQPGTVTSLWVMVTEPQLSVPVAEPLTATLVSAGHSRVLSAGQLMEG